MPFVQNGAAKIYFEEYGTGFPVLLLSAGFMRSRIDSWPRLEKTFPAYRFDPRIHLPAHFRFIAMDQRNALGKSIAPVAPADDWHSFASDQLAVMDSLGINRFHAWGGCIGAPFALELCKQAPERVVSIVMQDPIGVDPRKPTASYDFFMKDYAKALLADRADIDADELAAFGRRLFIQDFDDKFTFNVDRKFLRGCRTPMLVMPGWDDEYHPLVTSEEIVANAAAADYDPNWMQQTQESNKSRIRDFLQCHTPSLNEV